MPFLLWTLALAGTFAFARPLGLQGCGVYEFQGVPKLTNEKMILMLNGDTLSQVVIEVPVSEQKKLAPFIDLVTKGELRVKAVSDHKKVTVDKFSKLNYGEPNPANPTLHSYIELKMRQKCL